MGSTRGNPSHMRLSHWTRREQVREIVAAVLAAPVEKNGKPRTGEDLPLAQLEFVLAVRFELGEQAKSLVANARAEGATWQSIADVTGHASRGAAAKDFKSSDG